MSIFKSEDGRFSTGLSTDDILTIGRKFQMGDTWRGCTFDTAKLLCDEIERLRDRINSLEEETASRRKEAVGMKKDKTNMDMLEELVSNIRQKADYCHNNQLSKTWEDWERMCDFLLSVADLLDKLVSKSNHLFDGRGDRNCDLYSDSDRAFEEYRKFLGKDCEKNYRMDGAFNAIFWMLQDSGGNKSSVDTDDGEGQKKGLHSR